MSNTTVVNSPSEGNTVMGNTSAIVNEVPKGKASIVSNIAVVDRTPEGETSSGNTSVVSGETYGEKTALIPSDRSLWRRTKVFAIDGLLRQDNYSHSGALCSCVPAHTSQPNSESKLCAPGPWTPPPCTY